MFNLDEIWIFTGKQFTHKYCVCSISCVTRLCWRLSRHSSQGRMVTLPNYLSIWLPRCERFRNLIVCGIESISVDWFVSSCERPHDKLLLWVCYLPCANLETTKLRQGACGVTNDVIEMNQSFVFLHSLHWIVLVLYLLVNFSGVKQIRWKC